MSAVIVLGRALGFETVAEGVETEDQLAVLHDLGCDAAQGWWFARAVPAGRLVDTMRLIAELPTASELATTRTSDQRDAG